MTDLIVILLGGASGGSWYLWTGYVRTTKPCRSCGGWGFQQRRGFFGSNPAPCSKCDGTGRTMRLAARRIKRKRTRAAALRARRAVTTR